MAQKVITIIEFKIDDALKTMFKSELNFNLAKANN